jgi:hypothetical protein
MKKPKEEKMRKKILESKPMRYGKSTLVNNSFLAGAKKGESVEYHHPDYICMSRKRYEELSKAIEKAVEEERKRVIRIINDELIGRVDIEDLDRALVKAIKPKL